MKSMDIVLAIFTTLGGFSAIWFFWDKISPHLKSLIALFTGSNKKGKPELYHLSDSEFMFFFDGLIKSNIVRNNYLPTSDENLQLCNALVNHGFLLKNKDSSYKLTKEGKIIYSEAKKT